MKINILLSIIFISILCTCTKENTLLNPHMNEFLVPLNTGNLWEYQVGDDNITIESIDSLYVNNGINIYILNSDRGRWSASQAVYNTSDGYFIDNRQFVNENNHEYVFKYPCTTGMRWTNKFEFFGTHVTKNYELLSTNEKIELSSGIFHCFVYKVYSKDTQYVINEDHYQGYDKYYFDPQIGLVLIKRTLTDDNFNPIDEFEEITSRVLIDFSVQSKE